MLATFALYQNVKLLFGFGSGSLKKVVKIAIRLEPLSRLSQCDLVTLILDQMSKLQHFHFLPKCEIFEPFLLLEVGGDFWAT